MKRFVVTALALIACGPSDVVPDDGGDQDASSDVAVESGPTPDEQAAFDQLVQFTQTELQKSHVPGASIAIVLHGKLAFAAGVGKRNLTNGNPVTASTLFRVASMSKMIVGATAMSLVDQGKLDVNAPITNYLPWFSLANGYDAKTVTTAGLLTHTSGFPCDTIGICDSLTSGDRQTFFRAIRSHCGRRPAPRGTTRTLVSRSRLPSSRPRRDRPKDRTSSSRTIASSCPRG